MPVASSKGSEAIRSNLSRCPHVILIGNVFIEDLDPNYRLKIQQEQRRLKQVPSTFFSVIFFQCFLSIELDSFRKKILKIYRMLIFNLNKSSNG